MVSVTCCVMLFSPPFPLPPSLPPFLPTPFPFLHPFVPAWAVQPQLSSPTPTTHTGWRSGGSSPWIRHHSSRSRQDLSSLGSLRREAVGGPNNTIRNSWWCLFFSFACDVFSFFSAGDFLLFVSFLLLASFLSCGGVVFHVPGMLLTLPLCFSSLPVCVFFSRECFFLGQCVCFFFAGACMSVCVFLAFFFVDVFFYSCCRFLFFASFLFFYSQWFFLFSSSARDFVLSSSVSFLLFFCQWLLFPFLLPVMVFFFLPTSAVVFLLFFICFWWVCLLLPVMFLLLLVVFFCHWCFPRGSLRENISYIHLLFRYRGYHKLMVFNVTSGVFHSNRSSRRQQRRRDRRSAR